MDFLVQLINVLIISTDTNVKNRKQPCLVYSDLGTSRAAAVVIGYLVYSQRLPIEVWFICLKLVN